MTEIVCACCKQKMPTENFSLDKQKPSGFSSYCKQCKRAKNHSYYMKASQVTRRNQSHNGISVSDKNSYAKIWRSQNPEKRSEYLKVYAQRNRDKMRSKGMKRYVAQKRQTPSWVNSSLDTEIEGLYMFCRIFNSYKAYKSDRFQVDHIVPICGKQVSGLHVPWNLQVLTGRDNVHKGNTFKPSAYPQQGICAHMEI